MNRLLVRDVIRRLGPIARFEIAKETGLTPSTVTVIASELLEAGIIKEVGHGESSGGRRPILLELNPMAANVFAVRLQRGELVTAIFDLAQNILAEDEQSLDTALPDDVVKAIRVSFDSLVEKTGVDPEAILWAGVASPGLVSSHRGVVERSSNLDWVKVPLSAMISQAIGGIPVQVENISNAAALAEKEYGLGRGRKHLVFINLSVGIGAGIISDGEISGGVRGYAGEVGHVTLLADNGPLCACGNRGCLEAICGTRAVLTKVCQTVPGSVFAEHGIDADRLAVKDLLLPPLKGLPEVQRVVEETGQAIGILVANLVNLLNPEMIILGGELAALGDGLLERVRGEVKHRTLKELGQTVEIQTSTMRGSAALMGAYALALERVFALESWNGRGASSRPSYAAALQEGGI